MAQQENTGTLQEDNIGNLDLSGSMQSTDVEKNNVLENSLLIVQVVSKQYVVLKHEELNALGSDHKVICYADTNTHSLNRLSGEAIKNLPKAGIEEFLDGMVTAMNLMEQGGTADLTADAPAEDTKSGNAKSSAVEETAEKPKAEVIQIAESRDQLTSEQVHAAIRQALKLVSKSIDQQIDRWVMEAGDRMLKSSSFQGPVDTQRLKSSSFQLQSTSTELSKRFQARLIECLHKFNHPQEEQIDLNSGNLSLAEDTHWHKHSAILSLSSKIAGQTKLDYNQLNRRFSYLLNRRVKPEKNVIGPEMIAWCLCFAIDDVSYGKEQVDLLNEVVNEYFAGAMGKIYREINLLWIGLDILPQIKLRIWQDDYQP